MTELLDQLRAVSATLADFDRAPDHIEVDTRAVSALLAEAATALAESERAREALRVERNAAMNERDEARGIIAGRAKSPTAAEIAAIRYVGGSCTVSVFYGDGSFRVFRSERDGFALMLREAEHVASRGWSVVWRAFDVKGCPCAWPKIGEGE